jgi:quercetin dioxygenase-like cupin family protein
VSCSDKEVIAVACASDLAGQVEICSSVIPTAVVLRKPARRRMLMGSNRKPLALGPAEGEALWFGRTLTMVKAAAEQTAGAYSMIEDIALKGEGTPLHRHREDDEAFYVLEGEMTFYLGNDEPSRASVGSFVHIPGGTVHAFRVDSETARYLIITTPQHERFYRALTEPAQTRNIPPENPINMEKIGAACAAYGVEGVGPAPEADA